MCKFSLDWAERASGQFRSTLCYTISLEALKEGFLKLPTYAAAFSAIEKRAKRRDPLVAAFILFIEYYCSIARGNSDFYGLGAKKLLLNNNLNSWSIVVEACCLRQTSRPNLKRVVSCQHTVWVFLKFEPFVTVVHIVLKWKWMSKTEPVPLQLPKAASALSSPKKMKQKIYRYGPLRKSNLSIFLLYWWSAKKFLVFQTGMKIRKTCYMLVPAHKS